MSVKNIVDNLMEGIKFYINERIKFAPYDRTDTAIVKGVSEFGYVISYNNVLYSDIKTIGGTCIINETVKIMIPQNNMNNIFILKPPNGDNNYVSNDKITNSGTINTTGWVADARQLNPSISNTLAWNIAQTNSNLTDLTAVSPDFTKTVYGSVSSSTVGWVDKTVDLTNSSVVMLVLKNSNGTAILGSTFMPTYLFKAHDTIQCRVSINSTTFVECDAKYISNTQIQLYTNNASYVAWFYQFK